MSSAPWIALDATRPIRIGSDPVQPDAAIEWFRKKAPVSKQEWDDLTQAAKKRAFTVAWTTSAETIQEVKDSLDRAIASGQSFSEWKSQIREKLGDKWQRTDSYLDLVFRNNVQSAYSAGRFAAQTTPTMLKARPYWRLVVIDDTRTSPVCKPYARKPVVLPATHEFWKTHTPPLHHGCRSTTVTLSARQAERTGVTDKAPTAQAQDGWGSTDGLAWLPQEKGAMYRIAGEAAEGRAPAPEVGVALRTDFAKSMAEHVQAIRVNPDDKAAQAGLRSSVRGELMKLGIVPKTDSGSFYVNHWMEAEGQYNKGKVTISSKSFNALLQGLTVGPMDRLAIDALTTIIHEELHGASSLPARMYEKSGVAIEEFVTELLSRHVTRTIAKRNGWFSAIEDIVIGADDDGYFASRTNVGSYDREFNLPIMAKLASLLGRTDVYDDVITAMIRVRGSHPDYKSSMDQAGHLADELGLSYDEKIDFVMWLMDVYEPVEVDS